MGLMDGGDSIGLKIQKDITTKKEGAQNSKKDEIVQSMNELGTLINELNAQKESDKSPEKLEKARELGHRLSTALRTIEYDMNLMVNAKKGKLIEDVMKSVCWCPGGSSMLTELLEIGKSVENLQLKLMSAGQMADNTELLGLGYKKFLELAPNYITAQAQAKQKFEKTQNTGNAAVKNMTSHIQ